MAHAGAFDAILFDLDGTLLDSIALILDSFRHAFREQDIPLPSDTAMVRGLGIPLREFFLGLGMDEGRVALMIEAYRCHNLARHDACVAAFPGVVEVVRGIKARGLSTALVTSKNRLGAGRGLQVMGLEAAFDAIVTCDDVSKPKPDPEPVRLALSTLEVEPERALFVGDSLHDLHCGHAAGVRTGAALWGPFGRADLERGCPDFWLDSPSDLLDLLAVGRSQPRTQ